MGLQEFFDYKNRLMGDILTNESIVHMLNGEINMDEAEKLAYVQVFPFLYVPTTIHDGSTFICFDVDIQKVPNKTFLKPTIYIWVFAHRSRLRLPEGGVRTDKICSEIFNMVNGSRYYGLGEVNFVNTSRFAPVTDYNGKMITFTTTDFNRAGMPKKPIPSNRKTG